MINNILLVSHKSGKKYFVKDCSMDFHCTEGIVASKDLLNAKAQVATSSKGNVFSKIVPTLADLKTELARGPQIITEKDIGYIIAKTGVNASSRCVDAGGGTGALSLSLANICSEVTCYETNSKHVKVLEKNKKLCSADNWIIKEGDVSELLNEKDLDLVTLDLPNPSKVLAKVDAALKLGGWLVVYLPNILQMKKTIDSLQEYKSLKIIEVTEISKRDWKVEREILRPEATQIVHTGFMMFVRKL
ncbi:methyltransferase domain-containing protein [archaeon]|jgi:tRNA (adenine57-N1/adenine58-N1)-methyltransferase catalytic subunit|nr:methyltransferase domain-containing protein [archaeon]MBT6761454.1 methyltransferase domain-containing protein [archaeon]